MRGVNDRNFLNLWHMIYRATCPGLDATRWCVDAVEWRKDRHSFTGTAYSSAHEVHVLERGGVWRLIVVNEYWWDEDHEILKSAVWARMLSGTAKAALAWAVTQEKRQRAALPRD